MPARPFRHVALLVALGALAFAPSALATTFVPNKFGDHPPNGCHGNDCTLREAINAANTHPGPDQIILKGGKTYKLSIPNVAGDEDANATGDLDILDSLQIKSTGNKLATINAQGIDRVFEFNPASPGASVTFKLLRIRGGNLPATGSGGGVTGDAGSVRIVRSQIIRNRAGAAAGVLSLNTNTTTIVDSTISGNHSVSGGGAGGIGALGTLTVRGSTIVNNTTQWSGGGIFQAGGTLSVTNSTIANNAAVASGGGVLALGGATATLASVTLVRNVADSDSSGGDFGGGLAQSTSSVTVRNSIVAENAFGTGSTSADPECYGAYTSAGVNLLSNSLNPDCTGFGSPATNIFTSNPRLGFLAKNGGPTETIALQNHSPAINTAGAGSPNRDQRGVKRDHHPDIGAFERKN